MMRERSNRCVRGIVLGLYRQDQVDVVTCPDMHVLAAHKVHSTAGQPTHSSGVAAGASAASPEVKIKLTGA